MTTGRFFSFYGTDELDVVFKCFFITCQFAFAAVGGFLKCS